MLHKTISDILQLPVLEVNKEPRELQTSKGHKVEAMQKYLDLIPTLECLETCGQLQSLRRELAS